jgi:hypothetical protein
MLAILMLIIPKLAKPMLAILMLAILMLVIPRLTIHMLVIRMLATPRLIIPMLTIPKLVIYMLVILMLVVPSLQNSNKFEVLLFTNALSRQANVQKIRLQSSTKFKGRLLCLWCPKKS